MKHFASFSHHQPSSCDDERTQGRLPTVKVLLCSMQNRHNKVFVLIDVHTVEQRAALPPSWHGCRYSFHRDWYDSFFKPFISALLNKKMMMKIARRHLDSFGRKNGCPSLVPRTTQTKRIFEDEGKQEEIITKMSVSSDQVFIQAEEQRTRSSLIFGYKTFPKVSRTRLDNGRKMW